MLTFLKNFFDFSKKIPVQIPVTPDHLRLREMEEDVPRYPPFMKGLPRKDPQAILKTQSELLRKLKDESRVTEEIFDEHYMGPITRFAEFVHLLPASQSHHHRGAGGLLRHSLEVGLSCLRSADYIILPVMLKQSWRKREIEPRWLLTAFLAGLFHDVGKPVTDVIIRDYTDSKRWIPSETSLWDWLIEEDVDTYFLEWQTGRSKQHIALTGMMASELISKHTLAWISKEERSLMGWLLETFNGTPSSSNVLFDIVIKSDQESVEHDLKSMGVPMAGYDLGVPVEGMLIDIMRTFIRSERWSVNEPGARVWRMGGCVYLVWPSAGQDIAREVIARDMPGVPRNADSILDMFMERSLAFVDEGGQLYVIAPDVLTAKNPKITLKCIRLKDDSLVSAEPLVDVAGQVFAAQEEQAPVQQAPQALPAQPDAQSQSTTSSPIEVGEPIGSETGEALELPASEPMSASAIAVPTMPAQVGGAPQQQPLSAPPAPSRALEDTGVSDKAKGASRPVAKMAAPAPVPAPMAAPKPQAMRLTGLAGEALKALAEDLGKGTKNFDQHAFLRPDGKVMLRWPGAFEGYGLTIASLIADLAEKSWFFEEPSAPRVTEHKGGKVICLIDSVSQEFLRMVPDYPLNSSQKDVYIEKKDIDLKDIIEIFKLEEPNFEKGLYSLDIISIHKSIEKTHGLKNQNQRLYEISIESCGDFEISGRYAYLREALLRGK